MEQRTSWVWAGAALVWLGCESSPSSSSIAGAGGHTTSSGGSPTAGAGGQTTGSGGSPTAGAGGQTTGSGGTGEIVCDGGQVPCNGACVNVLTDPANCGECGQTCNAGDVCKEAACVPMICTPGEQVPCYSGSPGTMVGACHGGIQTCAADGLSLGSCVGEVLPQPEKCMDLVDDDCDGTVNNGCVWTRCSELPSGTPSGTYFIDPDGAGGSTPFPNYCEMSVAGGGWSLVASAADNTYFKGTNCDGSTPCDETPFSSAAPHGDIDLRFVSDYKSEAYSSVAFTEMLFQDSNGHYASYIVSAVSIKSVFDWYPVGLKNYVGPGVKVHPTYSFPVNETDMASQFNICGTLQLSFNVEDSDTPVGTPGAGHSIHKGPVWSWKNNNDCYWDEAGVPWTYGAFEFTSSTMYRLWSVR